MSIGIEQKPRAIKIISAPANEVEQQLADLGGEYAIVATNFATVGDRVVITMVLVHSSQLRMAQIASQALPPGMRH